jgi:hypothetical protein
VTIAAGCTHRVEYVLSFPFLPGLSLPINNDEGAQPHRTSIFDDDNGDEKHRPVVMHLSL